MNGIIIYLTCGVIATMAANRAWRLEFKPEKTTIGTLLLYLIGALLVPITLVFTLISFMLWALEPDQKTKNVKWPDWWGKHRWNQHLFWRWVWYLGQPPDQENWLSGWHTRFSDIPKEWKK